MFSRGRCRAFSRLFVRAGRALVPFSLAAVAALWPLAGAAASDPPDHFGKPGCETSDWLVWYDNCDGWNLTFENHTAYTQLYAHAYRGVYWSPDVVEPLATSVNILGKKSAFVWGLGGPKDMVVVFRGVQYMDDYPYAELNNGWMRYIKVTSTSLGDSRQAWASCGLVKMSDPVTGFPLHEVETGCTVNGKRADGSIDRTAPVSVTFTAPTKEGDWAWP